MQLFEPAISYFKSLLEKNPEVVITTHYNPDGDAIGSSLALYNLLKLKNIPAKLLVPNELPSFLQWMPGVNEINIFLGNEAQSLRLIENAEVIICMDFNALHRVKLYPQALKQAKATKVLIDHHIQPENDFDVIISETGVSSTSELLFHVLKQAGYANNITLPIAECLFVGIMTDTGSYSYSCNNAETFEITAELIRTGVDAERLHRMVYDTYSEKRMRLLGFCLGPRLKVLPQYAVAYIWLTKEDLANYDYQQGDTEGVVNYALSIENVAMSALFMERDDRIRVSLRSKGNFSVNEFARKHCNGGGHKNAAGGDIFMSMPETLAWFETLLPAEKENIVAALAEYRLG